MVRLVQVRANNIDFTLKNCYKFLISFSYAVFSSL